MTTVEDNRRNTIRKMSRAFCYDGSGSFADPHMELYLDGEKVTLTPNTGGTEPNFSGDLKVGIAQSEFEGKLDQLAIWDTDKGAGDFLAALYNEGEGRIIESTEEDLVLLALFNENYDDSTGTFTSPSLSGTETYDDPLVTDARGPLEPKMRFIPGLAMIKSNGEVLFYLEDALGSVMALADENGNIAGVYQYDAWGNVLVEPEDDTNPYRWCGTWGYYFDKNTEMYLLGLRWYDPRAGRFTTQDSIGFEGGDGNLYRFVENNPTNSTDSLGLQGDLLKKAGKCGGLVHVITDADIDAQMSRIFYRIETEMPLVIWFREFAKFMGSSGKMDTDFRFHEKDNYVYWGTEYPDLLGRTFKGGELNYIGVGAGLAAADLDVDYWVREWKKNKYGQVPSDNTLVAARAGAAMWRAYKKHRDRLRQQKIMEEIYQKPGTFMPL